MRPVDSRTFEADGGPLDFTAAAWVFARLAREFVALAQAPATLPQI
jgi:hypothetical protein